MSFKTHIIFAATAVLSAACNSTDSLAPRTASTSARADLADNDPSVKQSVDRYVFVSCLLDGAGETVHVAGDLRYDFHVTVDGTGVSHLNIKSNTSNLTGVGLTSGTLFRGNLSEHINSRTADYLNSDLRIADVIHFVAPGSNDSYSLMATTHIIIDQGTYVVFDQTWNEVCH